MAKVKKSKMVGSAIGGGFVPGMAGVQTYKYNRAAGASKKRAAAIGGPVGVASLLPGAGTGLGAYAGAVRSHQKQTMHPNQRTAKTAVRTSNPQKVRSGGRVGKR